MIDSVLKKVENARVFEDADKHGTFIQRVRWVVNTLFEAVGAAITGTLGAVLWLMLKSHELFQYFFIALILLALRYFFLWSVTEFASVITTLAKIIDAVLSFLQTGINDAITGFESVIGFINHDIIHALNKIPDVNIHDINIPMSLWTGTPGISPTVVHTWCTSLAPTCGRFDSADKIILYLFRRLGHTSICSFVRFMYPIEKT